MGGHQAGKEWRFTANEETYFVRESHGMLEKEVGRKGQEGLQQREEIVSRDLFEKGELERVAQEIAHRELRLKCSCGAGFRIVV